MGARIAFAAFLAVACAAVWLIGAGLSSSAGWRARQARVARADLTSLCAHWPGAHGAAYRQLCR